nr:hypothetical protein CFP56_35802 [Quercus suber]
MCGFKLCWLGSVPTEVGGFRWARLWVLMDGSAMGGYGSEVLVIEAFVVGSNVGVDDGDDEVEAKVRLFEEVGVAGGFEAEELRGASGMETRLDIYCTELKPKLVDSPQKSMPSRLSS